MPAKIVLFEPDIAGNVGSIIRTLACIGGQLHVIEPCGFAFNEQKIRRAAMDYFDKVEIIRHESFDSFYANQVKDGARLILFSTKAQKFYSEFNFKENDILLFGKESLGTPQRIADICHDKLKINMVNGVRSLNLAVSVSIIAAHFNFVASF